MITLASSAIYDGLINGIPVIRLKREFDVDFDPMDWSEFCPERDFIAYSSKDIKREVNRILCFDEDSEKKLRELGRDFVKQNFSPITEETLQVFLS